MSNIKINSKLLLVIKIVLIISCPFLTMLLSNGYEPAYILIGSILSLGIGSLIIFISKLDDSIDLKKMILYLLIACYFISCISQYSNKNIFLLQKIFGINVEVVDAVKLIGVMAIPITVFLIKCFFDNIVSKIILFFKNLTKAEKIFLYIVIIISSIFSIWLTYNTSAFSKPTYGSFVIDYDVIYTSDTGFLVNDNAYLNVSHFENDIRQPLFGIFSLPFSVTAKFISEFCFFCKEGYRYETVMTIIQYILLAISTILLARLLKLSEKRKIYFYILFSCSFAYLLFSILLEQYVISLFYLILTIYYYFENPKKTNFMYVGAVGTLITSGIIFPLISKIQNIKEWIISIIKCFLLFVSVFIMGGQISQLFTLPYKFNFLFNGFTGNITFKEKVYQYTAFIKGLFFSNSGRVIFISNIPRYQIPTYSSIEWIGVIILILCIISFILNRKNKIALISMLWIIFSSIILLFAGWGTAENGLVLYSLYFSWAFLILFYLLIDKIIKNKWVFRILIISFCSFMMIENLLEIIKIFKFAFKYY